MNLKEKIKHGVYFIAEMSANHAGSLETALKIVESAKDSGADCLKLQTYTADTLTLNCNKDYFKVKGGLWDGMTLYELYKEASMPWDWQPIIKQRCKELDLDFLSTPFDNSAVDFLEDLGVEFYKIASYELTDIPLIEYVASKGKPIVMSCGMGTVNEITEALAACEKHNNKDVILLKCCSEYPANFEDMNLAVIPDMIEHFGCPVGFSDHSMGHLADVVAVTLGACVIEKHFCLSRAIKNPDSEFSMEPAEFKAMVDAGNNAYRIKGKKTYERTNLEELEAKRRRSIFAAKDIAAGEMLSVDNMKIIRPGDGANPKFWSALLGKKAKHAIEFGEPILVEDTF
ncbi:MAG: pseudaminic acid synthase [Oscillospiraceae bacterium]